MSVENLGARKSVGSIVGDWDHIVPIGGNEAYIHSSTLGKLDSYRWKSCLVRPTTMQVEWQSVK